MWVDIVILVSVVIVALVLVSGMWRLRGRSAPGESDHFDGGDRWR